MRNCLSPSTRVVRSVVPANDLINDIDNERKKKLPEYGSFPVILSPYSNRGERIGARIPVYEEREKAIIKYTYVIDKDKWKKKKVLLRS